MNVNGFQLTRLSDGAQIWRGDSLPSTLFVPEIQLRLLGPSAGWNNGEYEITETSFEVPDVAPPIEIIRAAYIRAALRQMNKLDAVNAAISDPVLQELWNNATEIRRDDRDMIALASVLSIDVDAVWAAARAIRAARTPS